MNKKIFSLILVAVFAGSIGGSLVMGLTASAAPFSDILRDARLFLGLENDRSAGTTTLVAVPDYASVVDYESAIIRAVDVASPAVISIVISRDVPIIEQCRTNPFSDLPREFQDLFGQSFDLLVPCERGTERRDVGGGSGFIVRADGLIVTNKHVVSDAKASYTVFTNDGRKFAATVLATDPVRDIALIKINGSNLPTVKLGDSGSIKLGQTAIAIGNALGEFRNTVSVGVVSGLSRSITAQGAGVTEQIEGLIQTDAAINPGNSGGPLLNLRGEVIGMNTAMVSGAQSIGFAIPVNPVKQALQSVERAGRIVAPFLGVRYTLITPDLAVQNKFPVERGAWVVGGGDGQPAVVANSPAAKAGIRDGDIITAINGEAITIDNSLASLIQRYNVGDTITVTFLRSGKSQTVQVKLEERR